MGTFVGHILPGLALTLLGLWHTINTIRAYLLKGSTNFESRFWHPFDVGLVKFKYLELIFIFLFSIFAVVIQVLDFPLVRLSFRLDNFEHATMFIHLAIFAGFTLFAELIGSSHTLSGVTGVLAASVFGQELFLLHFHSADHVGLEGHYHWLLQFIVSVSFIAALAATCFPTSFHAALVLSISVVFQGCWFMNMGFMLWVPELVPQGCIMQLADAAGEYKHGAVICRSREARFRALALANLQFSWILSGILMFTGCICMVLAGKYIPRPQQIRYEQIHSRSLDAAVAVAVDGYKQSHP